MAKCKKCGAEFNGKFCSECGESAGEVDEFGLIEKQIVEDGVDSTWRKYRMGEYIPHLFMFLVSLAFMADGFILVVAIRVGDFGKTTMIRLMIAALIFIFIGDIMSIVDTYYKRNKVIKWFNGTGIDGIRLVLFGLSKNNIFDNSDTKRWVYRANMQDIKWRMARAAIIDAIIHMLCLGGMISMCVFAWLLNDGDISIAEKVGEAITFLGLMIFPDIIKKLTERLMFEKSEAAIDVWIKDQYKAKKVVDD